MGTVWELDFYSRPLVDETQKKRWELLICESPLSVTRSQSDLFRYSQYCASGNVNSTWLKDALAQAMAEAPTPPTKVRFFRRQMNNMIVKACKDMGLDAQVSRRTLALYQWLEERMVTVYPQDPCYEKAAVRSPSVRYEIQAPRPLPDALEGNKWAMVSLTAADFADLPDWNIDFGESFPLELLNLDRDCVIPGLVIYSPRAFPIAAWMSGLELGFIKFVPSPRPRLILETEDDSSWVLADLTNESSVKDAKTFEERKEKAGGAHFLAVQASPQVEAFAGFWLLPELNLR
jgi:hypothetical protein